MLVTVDRSRNDFTLHSGRMRFAVFHLTSLVLVRINERLSHASQDHFRAKIRIVLSKLCRKFGFEEIKALMPEQDRKLVAHMQTTAERELKAKKTRLTGGRGGANDGAKGGGGNDGGITKALRTFDTIMGKSSLAARVQRRRKTKALS